MNKKGKKIRKIVGIVISAKPDKTAIVSVTRLKSHPLYSKKIKVTKKYKVHDAKNELKENDRVLITETRPLSKGKRWKLVKKI